MGGGGPKCLACVRARAGGSPSVVPDIASRAVSAAEEEEEEEEDGLRGCHSGGKQRRGMDPLPIAAAAAAADAGVRRS